MRVVDEATLLKKAQAGDIVAFEALFRMHHVKIRSFALNICGGNRAIADDILQEAALNAFLYLSGFRSEASFSSWLWRIVRNEFLKQLKRADEISVGDAEQTGDAFSARETQNEPERELLVQERIDAVRRLIARLPVAYIEAVTLVDLQELSYEEAAELLAVPLNTLRVRVLRGRRCLAKFIAEERELFGRS